MICQESHCPYDFGCCDGTWCLWDREREKQEQEALEQVDFLRDMEPEDEKEAVP